MAEVMDGAVQQAPQPGRQFMGNQFMGNEDYDCIAREMNCGGGLFGTGLFGINRACSCHRERVDTEWALGYSATNHSVY